LTGALDRVTTPTMFEAEDADRILQRILEHHHDKTTEAVPGNASSRAIDAKRYFSAEWHTVERSTIFRSRPIAVCPVATVREAGDVYAQTLAGVPVLCVNTGAGIKVLVNRCRHRGASLVGGRRAAGLARLRCPFHGWSYALDGRLAHCPKPARAQLGIVEEALGLVELPSVVRAGCVFAVLGPNTDLPTAEAVLRAELTNYATELESLGLEGHHLEYHEQQVWSFNWKLGVDAALETYHFNSTHPGVAKAFVPALAIFDRRGDHQRMIFPKRSIVDLAERARLAEELNLNYFFFPASFVLKLKDHTILFRYLPIDVGTTLFEWFMLVAGAPSGSDEAQEHWRRNATTFAEVGAQDAAISIAIQAGFRADAAEVFTLTAIEPGVQEFHRSLERALAERPASP
jgi:phenylpropionate dioxygenase-like ring-hydroxylating dioxygenase large terminal subunit